MWYYIKEKKKVGPLSDAAIASLFSDGKISESTYVWTPQMPQWVKLKDSSIYRTITTVPESPILRDFKFYTYILRATLVVWILFLGLKLYYFFEALDFFRNIWEGRYLLTDIKSKLELSTIQSMFTFLNIFTWIVLFMVAAATMKWMYSTAEVSKTLDGEFKYSPYTSALAFIIPVFNLILPCRIIWNALISAIKASKRKLCAFDVALFASWWICWIITFVIFLVEKFTKTNGMENIQVSIYLSIYVLAMMVVTAVLWLMIVTRISNLQRKFYSAR